MENREKLVRMNPLSHAVMALDRFIRESAEVKELLHEAHDHEAEEAEEARQRAEEEEEHKRAMQDRLNITRQSQLEREEMARAREYARQEEVARTRRETKRQEGDKMRAELLKEVEEVVAPLRDAIRRATMEQVSICSM